MAVSKRRFPPKRTRRHENCVFLGGAKNSRNCDTFGGRQTFCGVLHHGSNCLVYAAYSSPPPSWQKMCVSGLKIDCVGLWAWMEELGWAFKTRFMCYHFHYPPFRKHSARAKKYWVIIFPGIARNCRNLLRVITLGDLFSGRSRNLAVALCFLLLS